MANASAKRIAAQNEKSVRVLRVGMVMPTVLSLLLRLIFRRGSIPPSKSSLAIYLLTSIPMFLLSNHLIKIGSTRREASTGVLISSGEDLSQPGVTEWCFDIIYITWACQIGSGALGDWFWSLYLIIPLYAVYKICRSIIFPILSSRMSSPAEVNGKETSNRQEKLRKRAERGDPRVRTTRSAR